MRICQWEAARGRGRRILRGDGLVGCAEALVVGGFAVVDLLEVRICFGSRSGHMGNIYLSLLGLQAACDNVVRQAATVTTRRDSRGRLGRHANGDSSEGKEELHIERVDEGW